MVDPMWCDVRTAFLKKSASSNFHEVSHGDTDVLVYLLINEALRLYAPTRRIYRELLLSSEGNSSAVAADVELNFDVGFRQQIIHPQQVEICYSCDDRSCHAVW